MGCSTTLYKPCSDGGDVSWEPALDKKKIGNRSCRQIQVRGKYLNDGQYYQYFPSGKIAIEGQFKNGLREGKWTQFDEDGKKLFIREYDQGEEKKAYKYKPL
jgi:antitoxin component YwqK of YwqJK toxin-antitoxin module